MPRLAAAAPDKLLGAEGSRTRIDAFPGLSTSSPGLDVHQHLPPSSATSTPHSPIEAESAMCRTDEEPPQCMDVLGAEIADSVYRLLFGQMPTVTPSCVGGLAGKTTTFPFLNFEVAVAG